MFRNCATFVGLLVFSALLPVLSRAQQTKTAAAGALNFRPAVSYASGGIPGSVTVADVNGDGYPDIIVANSSCCGVGGIGVLLGHGDGTFQPVMLTSLNNVVETNALAVVDINGDRKPDLIVATCCQVGRDAQAAVLIGNGDGTFQSPVLYDLGGTSPSITTADVNGDGRPDIVSANFNASNNSTVTVLLGNGDGTFLPAIASPAPDNAQCIAVADLNNDGKPDAIVCGGVSSVGLLLGDGNGTFQSFADSFTGFCTSSIAVADLTGHGFPDIIAANAGASACGSQGFAGILIGDGNGAFEPEVEYAATVTNAFGVGHVAVADVNHDGKPDVIIASGITQGGAPGSVAVLLANGDGTFQSAISFSAAISAAIAVAAADLNGDGKPDLVVGSLGSPNVSVLLNNTNLSKAVTTTVLTPSLNPSTYGQRVTFTAAVTSHGGLVPSGRVSFTWGIYTLGTATLNSSGVATLSVARLNADTFPLTAVYKGDVNNLGSTSPVLDQAVNQATSSATLTSSPNPSNIGQAVTFTARITSPTAQPSGPVMFRAGKTVLGSVNLIPGKVARFTTSSLPPGSGKVTATFAGDSDIQESSASVTQVVEQP